MARKWYEKDPTLKYRAVGQSNVIVARFGGCARPSQIEHIEGPVLVPLPENDLSVTIETIAVLRSIGNDDYMDKFNGRAHRIKMGLIPGSAF